MTTTTSGGTLTTFAGSTINYNGTAQTVKAVAYLGNLTLSGSGIKTLQTGTTTIGGNLTLSGTATATTVANLAISGNLSVGNGTTLTAGAFALTVTGTTTVGAGTSGTLSISSATGTKTFTGAVTINTGGALTESAAAALLFGGNVTIGGTLTESGAATVGIAGNLQNNGTYTASTGVHTFSGTTMTNSGANPIVIPSVTLSGAYTLSGTLTVSTTLAGAGTLIMGSTGVLNIGAATVTPTLTANAAGNTVNYTGGAQTVKATTYNKLIFSGTLAKSMATGTSVSGNLSIASGVSATIGTGLTLTVGSLTLNGVTQIPGYWGGTGSGGNVNTTYFTASTGRLNVSGGASKLAYTVVPSTGTAGTAFSVTVQAQDASGTPANLSSATTITLTRATGAGTLSGTLTGSIGIGANSVTISTPVYSKSDTLTLTATASGGVALPAVTSGNIVFSAGLATHLVYTTVPSTGTAGTAFSVTVQAQDANGNPANLVTATTITLTRATGAGTLSGTLTGSIGVGANSVTISTPVYSKSDTLTLTATASGGVTLTAVTSGNILFSAGPVSASASTLSASLGSVAADGSTTSTITVTLQDAYGNLISGKSVSLAKSSGPGSPTITTVVNVTDASGHGSWTVKSTTAGADYFQARDTTDDILVTATANVNFTAGVLHHYAVTFSASPAYASTPFVTTVTAQDINYNTVTTTNTTVVVTSTATESMMYEDPAEAAHYYYQANGTSYRTRTLSGGVATLNMQDTATGIGIDVIATDGTITGTGTLDISTLDGAYQTKGTGGDWAGATTWQIYSSGWADTTTPPGDTPHAPISILSGATVTVTSAVTANEVHVTGQLTISGATLTIQTGSGESPSLSGMQVHGTVTVASGGTLTIATGTYASDVQVFAGGVLENAGTITSTSVTLDFEPGSPGGKYRHLYTTTSGAIPAATWDSGAVCEIAGYTSASSGPSGLGQTFYDIVWSCASQAADVGIDLSSATINHNLTVTNTGSSGKALTLGGNATVASGGTVSVVSGARLDCATYVIAGGAAFDLQSGATLGIGSADGITPAGTASGNIQTTTRHFSSGANYVYNGTTTPQVAGSGLPAIVHTLTINNTAVSGVVSLSGGVAVNDTLTLTVGSLSIGAHTLTFNNAISTASGTLTGGASSAIVIGDAGSAATTTLPGVTSGLQNLTVNRVTGVTLGGGVTVSGTLTLTDGKITTGGNTLSVANTSESAISGASSSSYVYGTLKKSFAASGTHSFSFPIGDASNYTPVDLTGLTTTAGGTLTASTTSGQATSFSSSGISSSKYVNRYWTFTVADGLTFSGSYGATFNFVSGDVIGGANPSFFVVRRYTGSEWNSTTTGATTSTSTAATGLSAFSEFAVGEQAASAYKITANTATPAAGVGDQLTITLVDKFGNTDTSFSGDKNLTFSGLSVAGDGTYPTVADKDGAAVALGTATTITLASGVSLAGGSLVTYKAQTSVTLAATDGTSTTASPGGEGVVLTIANAGPVPAAYSVNRTKGAGLMILVSDLLAACSDANHDSLSLSSVTTPSTGEATVVKNATWILYTPASSSPDGDTFTYAISDSIADPVSGTVTVNVVQASGPTANMFALTFDISNHPVVSFAGILGRSYGIQRADSVDGTYETKATVQVPETGSPIVTWTDEAVTGGSYFYRTVSSSY